MSSKKLSISKSLLKSSDPLLILQQWFHKPPTKYDITLEPLLQDKDGYKNLNVIFGDENLENIWGPSELSIQAMLRMLVLIFDKLNSNVFFFFYILYKKYLMFSTIHRTVM